MYKIPKLSQSLFFKQQILKNLINQLQLTNFQQNLQFDPQIIDSLSSDRIIQKQLDQEIIINYQDITQSMFIRQILQNKNQVSMKQSEQKQLQNSEKDPKNKYFHKQSIKTIIDQLSLFQNEQQQKYQKQQMNHIKYLTVIQKSKLNQNTYFKACYQLTINKQNKSNSDSCCIDKNKFSIRISPAKQRCKIPQIINKVQIIDKICLIKAYCTNFNFSKQQIEKITILASDLQNTARKIYEIKLYNKEIEKQYEAKQLVKQKWCWLASVEDVIKYCYCLQKQMKYLGIQIKDLILRFRRNNEGGYQYGYHKIGEYNKQFSSLRNILTIMKIIKYFNQQLKISIGSTTYIMFKYKNSNNQEEQIPILTDFKQIRRMTLDLYAYDLTSLMNRIIQIASDKTEQNKQDQKMKQIVQVAQQIFCTGNPEQIIQKSMKIFDILIEKIKLYP